MILTINNVDLSHYIKEYGVTENVLTTDGGRNAQGKMTFDIITRKIKIEMQVKTLPEASVKTILDAISSYVVTVTYHNPKTQTTATIEGYVTTPQIEYILMQGNKRICKEFNLSVIEM